MEIHIVSSLTTDDESRLAPQVLTALQRILHELAVAYCVRIETSAGYEIYHSHTASAGSGRGDTGSDSTNRFATIAPTA